MLNLAVNGYSKEQIMDTLHAKNGVREVKLRFDLLNQFEIKIGELSVQPGGRINFNSQAEIKRTAQFVLKDEEFRDIDYLNDRIRPVFMLKMPSGYAEWPLGVFLLSSPGREEENGRTIREVEAYDASVMLVEDKFDNRYMIPSGVSYVEAIISIINNAGIRKVNIPDNGAVIEVDKEFEIGTSKIEVINKLLTEINYTSLWVDENGYFTATPYILPTYRETEYIYRTDDLSVIHPGSVEEVDLFNVPNVWIITASNPEKQPLSSRYVNDLATSKTSTVNRKRRIVDYRRADDIFDQNTLDAYTKRVAYESSTIYTKFICTTAIMPHHSYNDMLFIEHRDLNISAKYTESSWEMDLNALGRMRHEARRVIQI